MKLYTILFIYTILHAVKNLQAFQHAQEITFLSDLVKVQKNPTVITAFLCWNMASLQRLVQSIPGQANILFGCRRDEMGSLQNDHHTLFILESDCAIAEGCLAEFDAAGMFESPYRWIILNGLEQFPESFTINKSNVDSNMELNRIPSLVWVESAENRQNKTGGWRKLLQNVSALTDSNVLIANRNGDKFSLYQAYKLRSSMPLIEQYTGFWSKDTGLVYVGRDFNSALSMRRQDLKGLLLHVCFVITEDESLKHLTDYRDKHIDSIGKMNYVLTNHLVDFVNGSRNYSFEKSWGYKSSDGNWSGMVGYLQRKDADIGGTPLFVNVDRIPVLEYISMTTVTYTMFIFRQPPLSSVKNIFLLPFRWTVWSASGVLVLLGILILYGIAKLEDLTYEKKGNKISTELPPTRLEGRLDDVCMVAIGAVTQQGSVIESKSHSGRMTIALLFVGLMFLYTSYSANIVALLQSESYSIRTLADLLDSRLTLASDDTVYFRYLLPRQADLVMKAIWEKKISPKGYQPKFMSITEGIMKTRKGFFAFLVEFGPGYTAVSDTFFEHEKCGLKEIKYFQGMNPWYAIQKNSSFKELFKVGMRRIQETGLQFREWKRIYTTKPVCSTKGSNFISVGLVEVLPAIKTLIACCMTAIVVLFLELLFHRFSARSTILMSESVTNDQHRTKPSLTLCMQTETSTN